MEVTKDEEIEVRASQGAPTFLAHESPFHDDKEGHLREDAMPKKLTSVHLQISQQLMRYLQTQVLRLPNSLALLNQERTGSPEPIVGNLLL